MHPNPTSSPVTEWRGFKLSSFQIQAIEGIRQGSNVLVSAPTGAGKTLVAEFAMADAVSRGRRCVYTAPIKALSNQKYRDFRDEPEVDVGLMTGDVTIRSQAQVLIMTTEILRNAILENPDELSDVDYVILDEVHFMDDAERGSVWEESLIFAPPGVRFIALSATISNLEQVGAWIREIRPQELKVVKSEKRPVPLKHRLHHGDHVFDLGRLDWVRKNAATDAQGGDGRGKARRGRRGHRSRGDSPPPRGMQPGALDSLFDDLIDRVLLPTLVFSFSRRDCERLARRNQDRQLLDGPERARMKILQRELVELFQLDEGELLGEVFQLSSHGVAFHHAGMLPIHKEVIERLFTSGLLKLLFTTETFALGINMPARCVVFAGLRKFDGVGFDYLRTRDYLQMAGRAGRQGIDKEGLVITHLEPKDLEEAPMKRLIDGTPEPVLSRFRLSYATILHIYGARGRDGVREAWDKSFNQYQHRAKSQKARARNREEQHSLVDAHISLLEELHYLETRDGEPALTPRGKLARVFYGFELQITEMVFRGALENLPPGALAVVFVGLVHEERRRDTGGAVSPRLFGGVRRHVDQIARSLVGAEARHRIPTPLKVPDWGLSEPALLWHDGASFDEIEERTGSTAGDLCRTFRMAVQLLRQTRRVLDRDDPLRERLKETLDGMNRDEVDARQQLELG